MRAARRLAFGDDQRSVAPQLLGREGFRLKSGLDHLAKADRFVLEHIAVDEHLDVHPREDLRDEGLQVGGSDLCVAQIRSIGATREASGKTND